MAQSTEYQALLPKHHRAVVFSKDELLRALSPGPQMVNLDSLSVYWNSRTQLYTQMSREERDARFLSDVATSTTVPPDMKFGRRR